MLFIFHHRERCPRSQSGFALVATLLLMVLLVVVAVGLLNLSSITLRSAASRGPAEQARANARLGLMLALGQIQKHLGPDQRVSADARVAANGTGTPAHPHWVSVWKTTQENGSPWITRDGEKGGLADARVARAWKAKDERIACLVSGNETNIAYPDDQPGAAESMISLVDAGSLGTAAAPTEKVRAPRVMLGNPANPQGAYAWWVGDLGAQTNVATRDGSATSPNGKHHALMLAQDASWKAFGQTDLPNLQRAKLADEPQLQLVEPPSNDRHFHDLTVWSAGLPVDVRSGGWRRDLTAYLESSGAIAELKMGEMDLLGLNDSDNLVGRADPNAGRFSQGSPNFGLLRKWARRASEAPLGSYETDSEVNEMGNQSTGGRNSKSIDLINRTNTHLMPVLTEGSLFYNLSYYDSAKPVPANPFGMRVHYYPRVALWNPYNFSMKVPESAIFMQINGSKSVEVTLQDGKKQRYRMYWGLGGSNTGGAVRGSMFFKMNAATLKPGETLVWSPVGNTAYDEKNFANNRLAPTQLPHPARAFYQDGRADGFPLFQVQQTFPITPGLAHNLLPRIPLEWREIVPVRPAGNVQNVAYTQADDYIMSWKPLNSSNFNETSFSSFPMGRFVSCAYQYGDEDELPVEWTSLDLVPFQKSSLANPTVSAVPDRRTRDGFRLRWFQETESNIIGSGSLAGTPHLEDSAVGNWNLRASWALRNPFDNVTDVTPNFFGIYTRDLFDGEVDWTNSNPRASGGKALGDPFDQAVRSSAPRVLFDVPRTGTEIASLGAFQHANFSEFIWHPTYALGNSLADPRIPPLHTEPDRSDRINKDKGGWNQDTIGYTTDGRSNNPDTTTEDSWAHSARNLIQQAPLSQTVIYDLSYELNHTLWDSYFLSTGTAQQKQAFLKDPEKSPLPNGRMRPSTLVGTVTASDLIDYHRSASRLMIDGAFNVNSTREAAWEALLLSGVGKQASDDSVTFPRILDPAGGEWDGRDPRSDDAWAGQRVFTRDEIRKLAQQIVVEVESRGPFLSLADFINRRLSDDDMGKKGALQAAIDRAGLNAAFKEEWPLNNQESLPDYTNNDHILDPTRLEQTRKPDTTAWGALGFLTQADLLQYIGPALSARSDTFRIRAYGESLDASGKVTARAWCEAVVQRSPQYVDPTDDSLENPNTLNATNLKFGRRFEIVGFRWMNPLEI